MLYSYPSIVLSCGLFHWLFPNKNFTCFSSLPCVLHDLLIILDFTTRIIFDEKTNCKVHRVLMSSMIQSLPSFKCKKFLRTLFSNTFRQILIWWNKYSHCETFVWIITVLSWNVFFVIFDSKFCAPTSFSWVRSSFEICSAPWNFCSWWKTFRISRSMNSLHSHYFRSIGVSQFIRFRPVP